VRRLSKTDIQRKVSEVLELVHLPDLAQRKPRDLSDGQQQRVALARCIVYNPALILLDEPLEALDKKLREHMQLELRRIHAELGITMLNVTHDQDEALTMSDHIVLMNAGRIERQDSPENLYFRPATRLAADFIGTANLLPCEVHDTASHDNIVVATELGETPALCAAPQAGRLSVGQSVYLLIRPESLVMHQSKPPSIDAPQCVSGVLEDTIIVGSIVRYHVRVTQSLCLIVQAHNRRGRPPWSRGHQVFRPGHPKIVCCWTRACGTNPPAPRRPGWHASKRRFRVQSSS